MANGWWHPHKWAIFHSKVKLPKGTQQCCNVFDIQWSGRSRSTVLGKTRPFGPSDVRIYGKWQSLVTGFSHQKLKCKGIYYNIISYHITLYYIFLFYYIVLYYCVLYYVVLYYIILYYIILYYIILYYIISYDIICVFIIICMYIYIYTVYIYIYVPFTDHWLTDHPQQASHILGKATQNRSAKQQFRPALLQLKENAANFARRWNGA